MWRVVFSFRVRDDVADAAIWYEGKQIDLGRAFIDEIVQVWRELAENPHLAARKHPSKNLRWRYPHRFPYRIIYEVDELNRTILVFAVVHASQNDSAWRA
ncbi:MAG TPA: type II toxin-antitoxin system RelE/ParE family toxin [Lacunisphaera sp.]